MQELNSAARAIRESTLQMIMRAQTSHIGSCFSCIDLLTLLYANYITSSNDKCILSKGHAAAALYATLHHFGHIPEEGLDTFCKDGSLYTGHINHHIPSIPFSMGSLGHGLPIACGIAYAKKQKKDPSQVYVIVSDGELNEGSCWEAFLFCSHHQLNNLTILVDYNKIQSFGRCTDVLKLEPLQEKFSSFQLATHSVDGHSFSELTRALEELSDTTRVIIAHTIKGKGVSFMEDELIWHYKSPSEAQFEQAKRELCEKPS